MNFLFALLALQDEQMMGVHTSRIFVDLVQLMAYWTG